MNYYEILDVSRVATYEEIKAKHTMKMEKLKVSLYLVVVSQTVLSKNIIEMVN